MEYYRSIIEKYTSKKILNVPKSLEKTSIRAVGKLENTYFSSKAQIDSLLSNLQFIEIATLLVIVNSSDPDYSIFYNAMNDFLSDVDPKMTVDIISSTGVFLYSNKLTLEEVLEQSNQNTCPEVMASVNFVWGNPMINKTAFPIKPIYPDSVAPMVSAGYGLADRLNVNSEIINNQYVAKTWDGLNTGNNQLNDQGPLWAGIMTVRVSQNNFLL
jgi:hypothetical protein